MQGRLPDGTVQNSGKGLSGVVRARKMFSNGMGIGRMSVNRRIFEAMKFLDEDDAAGLCSYLRELPSDPVNLRLLSCAAERPNAVFLEALLDPSEQIGFDEESLLYVLLRSASDKREQSVRLLSARVDLDSFLPKCREAGYEKEAGYITALAEQAGLSGGIKAPAGKLGKARKL